jgi:uncharacterized protein YyaL (SSP411 family)
MPIAWMPWGEEAFARAAREDKPILLSISAVWCHWCHVMDDSTYANPEVIRAIDDRYVAVRVDNDERPDVNARYNMGGWPTTAFLSADGSTLTGATYLPPGAMLKALDDVARFYAEERPQIERRAGEIRSARTAYEPESPASLRIEMVDALAASVAEAYDPEFGGFGEAPKFPQPELLDFLLTQWRATGQSHYYEIVTHTLHEMARGGMYDHVEGGFFRYSTTRDWSVPHFEKMSEDHAGLIHVLAQLELWAPNDDTRATLRSALGYIRTVLRDEDTGFFAGSQDADEAYFALDLASRRKRDAPFVDRRSYSNWTSALAGAFSFAASALDDPSLALEATAALDGLHDRMRDDDGFLFHVYDPRDGARRVRGLLADHVAYLRALLDVHETTGETRFLVRAREIAPAIVARFGAEDGGFYDHARLEGAIGRLDIPDRPIVENAILAESLLRLAAMTDDAALIETAAATLALYAATFARAGSFAATYGRALRRYLTPAVTVRLSGGPAATAGLRAATRRLPDPFAVAYSDGEGSQTSAYLCRGNACAPPVTSPGDLRAAYESLAEAETPATLARNEGWRTQP